MQELPALRAYGSVISFSGRAEMISAATLTMFFVRPNPALQKEAKDLLDKAIGFSGRRNDIAHGYVDHHPAYYSKTMDAALGFVLFPSEFATKKRRLATGGLIIPTYQTPLYYYNSEEILVFTLHFRKLAVDARNYLLALRKFLKEAPWA
jgi:hypothetical protein